VQPGTTYGETPAAWTGSQAIRVFGVEIKPLEADVAEREQADPEGGRVASPHIHRTRATLSFSTHIVGSGTAGTPPAWGTLAQACGHTETTVASTSNTYSMASQNTGTFGFCHFMVSIGGEQFYCHNARGNCEETWTSGELPTAKWTFTGLENTPIASAILTPTYANTGLAVAVDAVNTPTFELGTQASPIAREFSAFTYNWGVETEFVSDGGGGTARVDITTRQPQASVTYRDTGLSAYHYFNIAKNETEQRLRLVHGPAGSQVSRVIPKFTLSPSSNEDKANQTYKTQELNIKHSPNVRDDSTLICS
jgi:hypothetical protein